jgi:glucokinase
VGGTNIAAGLVRFPSGEVQTRRQIPTAPARGGEAIFADVLGLCEDLRGAARGQDQRVACVGLGICELVDLDGNVVSDNCIAWQGQPVQQRLSKLAPAVVEADVRAAALAEAMFGAGKSFKQFLYVTVGTGISCCLVLDGKPFTGARGATGTMASSAVSAPCGHCGRVNDRTLEEIASGPALVARYNRHHPGGVDNGQAVLAAAAAGVSKAADVVRSAGDALGSTVALLVNVLDPEAVVIGGGLGLSDGLFSDSFIAATRRDIWSAVNRDLPIIRAATGRDAGLIGAATAAWKRYA